MTIPFMDLSSFLYTFGIHFRPNLLFRTQIQNLIRQVRYSHEFDILRPEETCVTLHLIKDDRIVSGYEGRMREWCSAHTDRVNKQPQGSYGNEEISYSTWMDFGCVFNLPYGDLTIDLYIEAAKLLFPQNRNFILLSDDPNWTYRALNDLKDNPRPGYQSHRYFPLASPRNVKPEDLQASNAEFWASIELSRQCQGIVFHSGSAASRFIVNALCYRSNRVKYLQCPDLFDLSGGTRNQF